MRKLLLAMALALTGCGESEPPLVGEMSESSICSAAGYLIRQSMTDNFKTLGVECTVEAPGGDAVEIESGYIAPPNDVERRYSARGTVRGSALRLHEIKVHGADDDFIPFREFGF